MQITSDAKLADDSELLEVLLEGTPEASYNAILSNALRKLENLIASGNIEPAENIAELLGTAVGKNSTITNPRTYSCTS